ncbi:MAG TPA: beta-ketoacyl-ACP synthase II [Acidimicrobiales bacterium]|nr:beta-ketoacyl-ACP synthase II [Acidimicrobiales bacterium]
MEGRRVAVTGAGALARCGIGTEAFWDGLFVDPGDASRAIEDFDPEPWFDNVKESRRTDRFAQFALAVAQMALDQAGDVAVDPLRRGVIYGTGVGGLHTLEEQILTYHQKGPRKVSPFLVPMMMSNAGAAAISMRHGWQGPCQTVVTACATGAHSIGAAARLIAIGRCDAVITGSSEAAMTPVGIQGFLNMTALSTSGYSRPFDVRRDGFVMAEGAGALVLEEWDHAIARGATILAEVLGAGDTADAHHITAPAPGGAGAIACMEQALDDAGLRPEDIAQINAHGTSTPKNDEAEAEAIAKVFGASSPPVTSIKGVTGHALGAAGSLEAVAVIQSMLTGVIPPTIGHTEPDPELAPIDLVTEPRPWTPGPTLSNSFGFGGHNGCLVLGPA